MTWSLSSLSPRVFTRPVDDNEVGFFHDLRFNGTASIVETSTVEVRDRSLFNEANISRTWITLKRLFPLLGASVLEDGSRASFCVSEARLGVIEHGEIEYISSSSPALAAELEDRLATGPSQLAENRLSRLYIISREDDPMCYQVIMHFAHIIIDGVSNTALVGRFFDILALPPTDYIPDLETRLLLVIGAQNLDPSRHLSLPRRRWRRVIAKVVHQVRTAKYQGGVHLPRKITSHTSLTPAKSRVVHDGCSLKLSKRIIANCRRHKITIGQAHPVLSQIAGARVLHRRYIRGEISEAEWDLIKKQPFNIHGPLNLRPYLDREWYNKGGSTVVALCINYFSFKLPFMPSNCELPLDNGSPSFESLISDARFLLRCRMVQKQSQAFMRHPLFFELAHAKLPPSLDARITAANTWRSGGPTEPGVTIPTNIGQDVVFFSGGSNFGNVDPMRPLNYPLPVGHSLSSRTTVGRPTAQSLPSDLEALPSTLVSAPTRDWDIRILSSSGRLRCRPTELYLGSITKDNQLGFWVSWDENVYEETMVKEWLSEFKAAAEWYLGREDSPAYAKL